MKYNGSSLCVWVPLVSEVSQSIPLRLHFRADRCSCRSHTRTYDSHSGCPQAGHAQDTVMPVSVREKWRHQRAGHTSLGLVEYLEGVLAGGAIRTRITWCCQTVPTASWHIMIQENDTHTHNDSSFKQDTDRLILFITTTRGGRQRKLVASGNRCAQNAHVMCRASSLWTNEKEKWMREIDNWQNINRDLLPQDAILWISHVFYTKWGVHQQDGHW